MKTNDELDRAITETMDHIGELLAGLTRRDGVTYRGRPLVPSEDVRDYEIARTIGSSVDWLRQARAEAAIDLRIALEDAGHDVPADADPDYVSQQFRQHRPDIEL